MLSRVQQKLKTISVKQLLVLTVTGALVVVGAYGLQVGDASIAGGAILILLALVVLLLLLAVRRLSSRLTEGFESLAARSVPAGLGRGGARKAGAHRGRAHRYSVLDYWARRYVISVKTLEWATKMLVKHRSLDGRDILAHAATRGGHNSASLSEVLAVWRSHGLQVGLNAPDFMLADRIGAAYARVLYRQRLSHVDLLDAVSIYEILVERGGKGMESVDYAYLVDATTTLGKFDTALAYLERFADRIHSIRAFEYLEANATNPHAGGAGSEEEWLVRMNSALVEGGLEPVGLRPGEEPPFFRLHCEVEEKVRGGPLISVLMPVYEANEATDLAIASILAQSWENLELIVVDDGSPEECRERLRRWDGADRRLRIVYNSENRGAYWARNTAYELARGEFVTVADKDDWHHPRKLEIQASELVDNPDRLVNMTSWVRVDRNLRFLVRWGPMRLVHPSFASIFFRREEVMEKLGFWDNVRKGGDGEYKFRMQRVFGVEIAPMNELPLAFSLLDEGNLTSSDLGLGFEHPNRTIYRKTYEQWHLRIRDGESPYMPKDAASRLFPAPRDFLPEQPEHPEFDVIFVSEFGFMGGSSRSLENEIEVCLQRKLKVGVVCVENLLVWSASDRGPSERIHGLILDGMITRLPLTDQARARLLVVRWPAVLQFRPQLSSGITGDRAIIVANHAPHELHERRNSYDPQTVSRNVSTLFGVEPEWVPQSTRIREMLVGLLLPQQLSAIDWVGILPDVEQRWLERGKPLGSKPIIGRHSRDALLKWPEREELEQVYPLDGEFAVRVLGGVSSLIANETVAASEIPEWTVFEFGEMQPDEFLRSIDFFVYYHHPDLIEAYGMTVVEAMASGAVVILPPHFEPVFGDAALYAEPERVRESVRSYWSDWGLYRQQSERGRAYVSRNSTPDAYFQRLEMFGVPPLARPSVGGSGEDCVAGGVVGIG